MSQNFVTVSSPGRICLFGEHQDYLGLPVVSAAISRRLHIKAKLMDELKVYIKLPDINSLVNFEINNFPLPYLHKRDYFRSALNVLLREGFRFSSGIIGELTSDIPVNSGTASSSSLTISWLQILSCLADNPKKITPKKLAELAYEAEVREFNEPGGMMDHYTIANGGIVYMPMFPYDKLESLSVDVGNFVLGDSGEPKDTIGIINRIRFSTLRIVDQLQLVDPSFSLQTTTCDEILSYKSKLNKKDFDLIWGTVDSRDITNKAVSILRRADEEKVFVDQYLFGKLLNDHNENLRQRQKILTPKINRMLDAALQAGAHGGKINGSGGGGCMFAYAPSNTDNVVEAIERVGGRAYIVSIDDGISMMQYN